jgi:hypothetical protein
MESLMWYSIDSTVSPSLAGWFQAQLQGHMLRLETSPLPDAS